MTFELYQPEIELPDSTIIIPNEAAIRDLRSDDKGHECAAYLGWLKQEEKNADLIPGDRGRLLCLTRDIDVRATAGRFDAARDAVDTALDLAYQMRRDDLRDEIDKRYAWLFAE